VPTTSLYIDREGCGVVTILVGSKRRCPELNTEGTFHRNPASLAFSTLVQCSRCCTSCCFCSRARPGPMACSNIAGEPYGSCLNKPLSISWLTSKAFLFLRLWLVNRAWSRFFRREAFKWSCLKEVFWVMCSFLKKKALSECSPRASGYLEQKVGGS
jgi:hypothetical protein